jgi:hypothetical protein
VDSPVLRVLTMIEDTLARHYHADALPAGHPVREACDELRRLRAERDALVAASGATHDCAVGHVAALRAERDSERACGAESLAMYRRCRDERDALRAELDEANERRAETIAMCEHLRADAVRYRLLAARMIHVAHPAGSGWALYEVLVSNDADLDETVDAMAKEQICAVAKSGQIPGAMSKEIMQQALDALTAARAACFAPVTTQAVDSAIDALRAAVLLDQQRAAPSAEPPDHTAVMRQALEALEERYVGALRDNAIDALRATLGEK